jgi:hypothetical protein
MGAHMYMHDKLLRARGTIFTIGLGIVFVVAAWELLIR